MKKIISLIVFSFIFSTSQAQSTKGRTALGVSISGIGDNTAFHLTSLDGGGSYSGKGYYSLAITYLRSLPNKFDLETGVEYGKTLTTSKTPQSAPMLMHHITLIYH